MSLVVMLGIHIGLILIINGAVLPQYKPLVLMPCEKFPYGQFKATESSGHTEFSVIDYSGTCIDCNGCQIGQTPQSYDCSTSQKNQWWTLASSSNSKNILLQSTANKTNCIEVINDYYTIMSKCDDKNIHQQFIMNSPKTGYIAAGYNSSLCLSIANYNCNMSSFEHYPYCNQSYSITHRVNDLISRMTLYEKVNNLVTSWENDQAIGVPRLGVPLNRFGESLHGVMCGCGDTYNGNTGCPTSFPHALLLSCSFNRTLWGKIGEAISTEVRGFENEHHPGCKGLFRWSPNINLFRYLKIEHSIISSEKHCIH